MSSLRIFSTAAALALAGVAMAQSGFTPLGGFGAGCSFAVETAVSGAVRGDNGWCLSHGAMPVLAKTSSSAGVNEIVAEPEGPVEIYSLDGRRVLSDIESLDPGIYIIAQKGIARKFVKSAR